MKLYADLTEYVYTELNMDAFAEAIGHNASPYEGLDLFSEMFAASEHYFSLLDWPELTRWIGEAEMYLRKSHVDVNGQIGLVIK